MFLVFLIIVIAFPHLYINSEALLNLSGSAMVTVIFINRAHRNTFVYYTCEQFTTLSLYH
jgi:hypothetical protein